MTRLKKTTWIFSDCTINWPSCRHSRFLWLVDCIEILMLKNTNTCCI